MVVDHNCKGGGSCHQAHLRHLVGGGRLLRVVEAAAALAAAAVGWQRASAF